MGCCSSLWYPQHKYQTIAWMLVYPSQHKCDSGYKPMIQETQLPIWQGKYFCVSLKGHVCFLLSGPSDGNRAGEHMDLEYNQLSGVNEMRHWGSGNKTSIYCLLPMQFMLQIAFKKEGSHKIQLYTRNTWFVPKRDGRITIYLNN